MPCLIALVVRTFAIEPFNIPSGSMIPTLLVGDYLFVSKYSYGYSKHSFPFSAGLFPGRIFGSPPERGDVAVFKYPGDQGQGVNRTDYIKRIVGMPGDRIQMMNGVLHINGTAVAAPAYRRLCQGHQRSLPEGHALQRAVAERPPLHGPRVHDNGPADNTPEFLVPAGSYFVMGDNRDDSLDSRTRLMLRDFCRLDARPRPVGLVRSVRESRGPRRVHLLLARSVGRWLAGAVEMAAGHPLRTASSWRSTECDRRRSRSAGRQDWPFFRARRTGGRGAHPSRCPRPPVRSEGGLSARQRTAGISRRPRAVACRGRSAACAVFRRNAKANWPAGTPRSCGPRRWWKSPRRIGLGAAICGWVIRSAPTATA